MNISSPDYDDAVHALQKMIDDASMTTADRLKAVRDLALFLEEREAVLEVAALKQEQLDVAEKLRDVAEWINFNTTTARLAIDHAFDKRRTGKVGGPTSPERTQQHILSLMAEYLETPEKF